MGMFDYVYYMGYECQTKNLSCQMAKYVIIENKLYIENLYNNLILFPHTGELEIYDDGRWRLFNCFKGYLEIIEYDNYEGKKW